MILCSRVKRFRIFSLGNSRDFFTSLADCYAKNMQETQRSGLKNLIKIFPSSITFYELLRKHEKTGRGMLFFKLAVDILENYYKTTEAPMYEKLRKEVIPLAIKTYSNLSAKTINDLNHIIKTNVRRSNRYA